MKRKGDKGSPCQSPRNPQRSWEGAPFTKTEKNDVIINDLTHLVQARENSIAITIDNKNFRFNLSYDLEIYSFIIILGVTNFTHNFQRNKEESRKSVTLNFLQKSLIK